MKHLNHVGLWWAVASLGWTPHLAAAQSHLAGVYQQAEHHESMAAMVILKRDGRFEFSRAYSYDMVQGHWEQTDPEHITLRSSASVASIDGSKPRLLHEARIAGFTQPLRTWWVEAARVPTGDTSVDGVPVGQDAVLVVDSWLSGAPGAAPAPSAGKSITARWSNGQSTLQAFNEVGRATFLRPQGPGWRNARITSLYPDGRENDADPSAALPPFSIGASTRYVRILVVAPSLFDTLTLQLHATTGQRPTLTYGAPAQADFPDMDRDTPFDLQP